MTDAKYFVLDALLSPNTKDASRKSFMKFIPFKPDFAGVHRKTKDILCFTVFRNKDKANRMMDKMMKRYWKQIEGDDWQEKLGEWWITGGGEVREFKTEEGLRKYMKRLKRGYTHPILID